MQGSKRLLTKTVRRARHRDPCPAEQPSANGERIVTAREGAVLYAEPQEGSIRISSQAGYSAVRRRDPADAGMATAFHRIGPELSPLQSTYRGPVAKRMKPAGERLCAELDTAFALTACCPQGAQPLFEIPERNALGRPAVSSPHPHESRQ
jgi:hypothetical protein